MGVFKDFIKKIAEKQKESNERIRLKTEESKERVKKINQEGKEKIKANNEKHKQRLTEIDAKYKERIAKIEENKIKNKENMIKNIELKTEKVQEKQEQQEPKEQKPGFWDGVKKEREKYTFAAMVQKEKDNQEAKKEAKKTEKEYKKERLEQLKRDHVPFCPKCKSTSLTYLDKRKKLSLGRAVVGGAIGSIAGPLGTAAGATMGGLSSDKIKKGKVKCLNCGHTWKI